MIDFQYFYEQSLVVTHKVINLLLFLAAITLLFSWSRMLEIAIFLINQIYINGFMNSGNISVIFIGIIIASYLYEHFSRLIGRLGFIQISWTYKNFDLLITTRFLNIVTVMNDNDCDVISDVVNESVQAIYEPGAENSRHQRMFKGRQDVWRFLTEYAGTTRLIIYMCIVDVFINLHLHNYVMVGWLVCAISLLMIIWFLFQFAIGRNSWLMLNRYWSGTKITSELKLTKKQKHDYDILTKANKNEIQDTDKQKMFIDVLHAQHIILRGRPVNGKTNN